MHPLRISCGPYPTLHADLLAAERRPVPARPMLASAAGLCAASRLLAPSRRSTTSQPVAAARATWRHGRPALSAAAAPLLRRRALRLPCSARVTSSRGSLDEDQLDLDLQCGCPDEGSPQQLAAARSPNGSGRGGSLVPPAPPAPLPPQRLQDVQQQQRDQQQQQDEQQQQQTGLQAQPPRPGEPTPGGGNGTPPRLLTLKQLQALTELHVEDAYACGIVGSAAELAECLGTDLQDGLCEDQVRPQSAVCCRLLVGGLPGSGSDSGSPPLLCMLVPCPAMLRHECRALPRLQAQLAARAARYGTNTTRPPKEVTFLQLVAEALQVGAASALSLLLLGRPRPRVPACTLSQPSPPPFPFSAQDFTILVLLGAGCLSLGLELLVNRKAGGESSWIEGASILAAGAGAACCACMHRAPCYADACVLRHGAACAPCHGWAAALAQSSGGGALLAGALFCSCYPPSAAPCPSAWSSPRIARIAVRLHP